MRLYLDDIRNPKNDGFVVARTYEEAVRLVEMRGMPSYISFDHDLGEDEDGVELKSGYDFAKRIVEADFDKKITIPKNFDFNVHSANPVGAKNIEALLRNYFSYTFGYKAKEKYV